MHRGKCPSEKGYVLLKFPRFKPGINNHEESNRQCAWQKLGDVEVGQLSSACLIKGEGELPFLGISTFPPLLPLPLPFYTANDQLISFFHHTSYQLHTILISIAYKNFVKAVSRPASSASVDFQFDLWGVDRYLAVAIFPFASLFSNMNKSSQ